MSIVLLILLHCRYVKLYYIVESITRKINVGLYSIADGVPYDGVPETNVERIHTSVSVIFCVLSTCGVVFAISCMLFNFVYRNKK